MGLGRVRESQDGRHGRRSEPLAFSAKPSIEPARLVEEEARHEVTGVELDHGLVVAPPDGVVELERVAVQGSGPYLGVSPVDQNLRSEPSSQKAQRLTEGSPRPTFGRLGPERPEKLVPAHEPVGVS